MFDNIHIDTSMLPESEDIQKILKRAEFQTKSLDNVLQDVYINKDGTLTRMMYHYETREPETNETGLMGIFNSLRIVEDGLETMDLTGTIEFYAYAYDVWYEYVATYVDGKLQNIVKV